MTLPFWLDWKIYNLQKIDCRVETPRRKDYVYQISEQNLVKWGFGNWDPVLKAIPWQSICLLPSLMLILPRELWPCFLPDWASFFSTRNIKARSDQAGEWPRNTEVKISTWLFNNCPKEAPTPALGDMQGPGSVHLATRTYPKQCQVEARAQGRGFSMVTVYICFKPKILGESLKCRGEAVSEPSTTWGIISVSRSASTLDLLWAHTA